MRAGRLVGEVPRADATEAALMRLMAGVETDCAAYSGRAGEVIERVARVEVGGERASALPVAAQVHAPRDPDARLGTEILEIRHGERVRRTARLPRGGVDRVARLAAAPRHVDAVLPVAEIDEPHRQRAPDAQRFRNHARRLRDFLQRARTNHAVKTPVRKRLHEGQHVTLDRQ
jgi:hypothetical protein